MLIKNVFIENNTDKMDIRISDGKIETIMKGITGRDGEEILNCEGKLLLPPFIESHVHLDTCLTAGEPCWNQSGTLFEGIECWSKRKQSLTKDDVKTRVNKAIRMQAKHGVQYVRTHVDTTDPALAAMEAILELREEVRDFIEIQVVAFPQEGIMSYPDGEKLMIKAVEMGADVVGAIPHFEFTREYSVESLNFAVKLAEKHNRLIDVHCDEIDDEASRGLETLAARAYETGMKDRVTASHTTAMHSYNNAYAYKLFRLLAMSDINFVCNPLVNTHIAGRTDAYPKRRGVTRVKELLANGNNVSMGHDDIFDPWYSMGTGNMMTPVHMGLHICHMMGYNDIMDSYKFITTNAARTLNLGDSYGIREGAAANFIILDAANFHEAITNNVPVLYSYRKGKLIASTIPAQTTVKF